MSDAEGMAAGNTGHSGCEILGIHEIMPIGTFDRLAVGCMGGGDTVRE